MLLLLLLLLWLSCLLQRARQVLIQQSCFGRAHLQQSYQADSLPMLLVLQ
jgi:hypothetical protein